MRFVSWCCGNGAVIGGREGMQGCRFDNHSSIVTSSLIRFNLFNQPDLTVTYFYLGNYLRYGLGKGVLNWISLSVMSYCMYCALSRRLDGIRFHFTNKYPFSLQNFSPMGRNTTRPQVGANCYSISLVLLRFSSSQSGLLFCSPQRTT